METILFIIAGVIPEVIRICDKREQVKYKNLAWALILTTVMAFIGGCDIARQFCENTAVILGVGGFWAIAVFSFDYFLMCSDDVALTFKIIRFPVGIANVAITTVALMVLLNQSSIDNTLALRGAGAVSNLDSGYFAGKNARYAGYEVEKRNIAAYHREHCMPEAGNGYPGPKYDQLHAVCIETQKKLTGDVARLDNQEASYRSSWQLKRKAQLNLKHNDFFSKADLLPEIIRSHASMIFLVTAMTLVLLYIEVQALIMKLSVKHDDQYHQHLATYQQGKAENAKLKLEDMVAMDKGTRQRELEAAEAERERKGFRTKMDQVHEVAKREYEAVEAKAIYTEKGYEESAAAVDNIMNEFIRTARPNPLITPENIFHMTLPMKIDVDAAMAGHTEPEAVQVLFDLVTRQAAYDDHHSRKFYRCAADVYNNGLGVCGEQAVLLMAYYRYVGIACWFASVSEDEEQQPVIHACVALNDEAGQLTLVDPGQKQNPAYHRAYELLSDVQLLEKYKKWNA
jgi:hypothetical protein